MGLYSTSLSSISGALEWASALSPGPGTVQKLSPLSPSEDAPSLPLLIGTHGGSQVGSGNGDPVWPVS